VLSVPQADRKDLQLFPSLLREFEIPGNGAQVLGTFLKFFADINEEPTDYHERSPRCVVLARKADRLFEEAPVPAEVHRATFAYVELAAKMLNPRLKVSITQLRAEGDPCDEFVVEEVERRLF
jgi:hypothetical protein